MKCIDKAERLSNVAYDIRGELDRYANKLTQEGEHILKLNIGNPPLFGFKAPDSIIEMMSSCIDKSSAYGTSTGSFEVRNALAMYYRDLGGKNIDAKGVFLGNGVSELISMSIQSLVNPGDEILIPAPDYPLWTSVVNMYQGKSVHYICDEKSGWLPDLNDIESKITAKTKAIVVINPNNPTGAIYDKQTLQSITNIARKHNLLILSDEIYDRVLYDEAIHHTISAITDDVVCLTFSGLSKSVNLCGIRAGWLLVSGKPQYIKDYLDGLYLLSAMRLCPNVPMQYAIKATLEFYQSKNSTNEYLNLLVKRRNLAFDLINRILGVSCIKPKGALYMFIKLDTTVFDIVNDKQLALEFLKKEKVLILHGSAFNWFQGVYFRLVFLPSEHDIKLALARFERFLMSYRIDRKES